MKHTVGGLTGDGGRVSSGTVRPHINLRSDAEGPRGSTLSWEPSVARNERPKLEARMAESRGGDLRNRQRVLPHQREGIGECCKLPQWGLG